MESCLITIKELGCPDDCDPGKKSATPHERSNDAESAGALPKIIFGESWNY